MRQSHSMTTNTPYWCFLLIFDTLKWEIWNPKILSKMKNFTCNIFAPRKKFWKCPMTLILFRGHRGHQLDSQEYFHHAVTTCSLCPARAPKTVWIFTKNNHLSLISNFPALNVSFQNSRKSLPDTKKSDFSAVSQSIRLISWKSG